MLKYIITCPHNALYNAPHNALFFLRATQSCQLPRQTDKPLIVKTNYS